MAIYDIFNTEKAGQRQEACVVAVQEKIELPPEPAPVSLKDRFLSSLCARLFFFFLLLFDLLWFCFSLGKLALLAPFCVVEIGKKKVVKTWLSIKRSLLCALALFVSLFSPAFGIMIACTYFLMYDKEGIEEVVPASLKEQFKDLFAQGSSHS